jgi:tetratricopeptide (TPR) repeat protein
VSERRDLTELEALSALRGDDPARAARAADLLWQMWHRSGNPRVDSTLRQGIEAMQRQEIKKAEAVFTHLIEIAPDFAEGWNKRATARFIAKDYPGSIADCRETLARNPNHFGALSGQGLCHMARHEYKEAAELFRRALAVHPHLENARANLRAALNEVVKWN